MNADLGRVAGTPDNRPLGMSPPIGIGGSADGKLQLAYRWYREQEGAIQALGAEKLGLLQHYDVPGMETALALCFWGRSGSFLLASYLDGHDDIVMLPMVRSEAIYPFFHEYRSLSIWEKLVAYPVYSEGHSEGKFFEGDFTIPAADYYAAIHALFAVYGGRSAEWLDTRPRFFQFVHAAYAVATGRRPGNPRPLMVYAQHWTNEEQAGRFVEDFPSGRFIHTVRDPISALDSWFDRQVEMQIWAHGAGDRAPYRSRYLSPAVETVKGLVTWDRAHRGMDARTRAIRFEDLHIAPEATMRRLADWLGIAYRPCLLESTWNRTPYVIEIRGVPCCGPDPANARRRWKNLNPLDRLLIFALLYDNFSSWNYPCPGPMRRRWLRLCIIAALWLIPMKMEMASVRIVMRIQVLPALRRGRLGFACGAIAYLFQRRLRMMLLILTQAHARLTGKWRGLKLL
jgi:hypothetical protein